MNANNGHPLIEVLKIKLLAQKRFGCLVFSSRIQDIDFDYCSLQIWHAKGGKHRRVTLAKELIKPLKEQIAKAYQFYQQDINNINYQRVYLPYALARKFPNAEKEFNWHFLFPSSQLSIDPETNVLRRHHINETSLQKAIKNTAPKVKIGKKVTCHTLRHSFITKRSRYSDSTGTTWT